MKVFRILPEAEQDLNTVARHYESLQPGLGALLLGEVRRTTEFLARHPRAARIERAGIRVKSIARFPYRLYYCLESDGVLVVAVAHIRRRPGFLSGRLLTP